MSTVDRRAANIDRQAGRPVVQQTFRRRRYLDHQEQILAHLAECPGQTTVQIAAALGLNGSVTRHALVNLEEQGQVARSSGREQTTGVRGRPAHRWSLP